MDRTTWKKLRGTALSQMTVVDSQPTMALLPRFDDEDQEMKQLQAPSILVRESIIGDDKEQEDR